MSISASPLALIVHLRVGALVTLLDQARIGLAVLHWRLYPRICCPCRTAQAYVRTRDQDCQSYEFYRRFESGELADDDDLMMWADLYHLYLTSLPTWQFMKRETAST